MPKRKRSSVSAATASKALPTPDASILAASIVPPERPPRRASARNSSQPTLAVVDPNPDANGTIRDGRDAIQASADEAIRQAVTHQGRARSKKAAAPTNERSPVQTAAVESTPAVAKSRQKQVEVGEAGDPEAVEEDTADPEAIREALSRPPPVNSSYLPLPWKGRLGYACLNTYLRSANPPVFSSRTCRIASILEHRHPLKDPTLPEHATKNRPDKNQPPDIARGQAYVEALGLANARDIVKMLRWNERYGIKFLRLSSEMFPFASHDVYGYQLAPFASEALAEAGRVAAELGHRLTTHPGQFTQLGSPRREVIAASIRELEYHCELLELLKLPPQQDRDAVMILHMGGIFGDKAATLERFKENYQKLSRGIKNRLVLENDDVCYSVHDLLPICEELNIPLVLDYHHHNLIFDAERIREGTLDIMDLYDRIQATWTRKGITQKMHYSEPTPSAITLRQRRKHNPRVATLPPCAPDMDLMIEAKDKEQAVFELMRIFKLPGFDTFNDVLPHVRNDENRPWKVPKKKKMLKRMKGEEDMEEEDRELQPPPLIPDSEVSMGGSEGRVYWPPGMEEWLRPTKREVKARDPAKVQTTAEKAAQRRAEKAAWQAAQEAYAGPDQAEEREISAPLSASEMANGETPKVAIEKTGHVYNKAKTSKARPVRGPQPAKKPKSAKAVLTPSTSDDGDNDEQGDGLEMPDLTDADEVAGRLPAASAGIKRAQATRTPSGRTSSRKRAAVRYAEDEGDD